MEEMRARAQVCRNCGRKLVPGAAFCGGCGTPIESAGPNSYMEYGNEPDHGSSAEYGENSGEFPVYGNEENSGELPVYGSGEDSGGFPEYGSGEESGGFPVYESGSDTEGFPVYESGEESGGFPEYGSTAGAGASADPEETYREHRESGTPSSVEMMKDTASEMAGAALRDAAAVGGAIGKKAKEATKESRRRYESWKEEQMSGAGKSLDGTGKYRKAVRNYFLQVSHRSLFCFLGAILTGFIPPLSLILFIAGIIFLFIPSYAGQKEADEAKVREIDRLEKRGLAKLNVEMEEVSLIDPVVIYGPGAEPNRSLGQTATGSSFFLLWPLIAIARLFMSKVSKYDPILLYRFGSDNVYRYMLLQVTVYAFSNEQVFVYSGNVDTSTGRIYDESVMEVYYRDIAEVATKQELTKGLKGRKFLYYVNEYIELSGPGFRHLAAVASSLDNRKTDEEFLGMKNLIRDKKKGMR